LTPSSRVFGARPASIVVRQQQEANMAFEQKDNSGLVHTVDPCGVGPDWVCVLTAEIKRDLEQRKWWNEVLKRQDLATEAAVRELKVDWSLFQSKVACIRRGCKHDLRACRGILQRMDLSKSEVALVLTYLPLQGGHCDCEVFLNVDMTNPSPLPFRDCVDCGADFDEFDYIVKDAVWAAGGLEPDGGKLCIGCLERRLGRQLNRDDFEPKYFPRAGEQMSRRLRDRRLRPSEAMLVRDPP
jgi:uncharacterized protein DUF2695